MVMVVFGSAYMDMGFSHGIIYRQETSRAVLSSLYFANLIAGVVIFVVLALLAPVVAKLYDEPRLLGIVLVASLTFLVVPVGQQFKVLLEKELNFRRIACIEVTGSAAGFAVAIISASRGAGAYSIVFGQLVNSTIRATLFAKYGVSRWCPQLCLRLNDIRAYLRFGVFQMGERTLNLLSANLDKLLISGLLGFEALGVYHVAHRVMQVPSQFFNPVLTRVAFPVFARMQTDLTRLRRGFLKLTRVVGLAMFPVYAGMFVVAEELVVVLLGAQWVAAAPVLKALAILGAFFAIGNLLGSLLLAKGRADIGFYINALRLFLFGAAISVGASYGLTGIAWALVLSVALVMFPLGFWVRWMVARIRVDEYLNGLWKPLLASVSMVVALFLLKSKLSLSGAASVDLATLVLVGAVVYGCLICLLDWRFLYGLVKRVAGVPTVSST